MNLWEKVPGSCTEVPVIEYYPAAQKKTSAAMVIFPGGGYAMRAEHEGKGYAELFNRMGMDAFVVEYRVAPHHFPLPLLDARRGIRWVRAHAEGYGIDPNRIGAIGSSAGGHLTSLLCTYLEPLELENQDQIDTFDFLPNAQILCYPVIALKDYGHIGSGENLLGDDYEAMADKLMTADLVNEKTPQAFIWHTAEDNAVPVQNSLVYTQALRNKNIDVELHIFPKGPHGLGCAPEFPHVAQWTVLVENWLRMIGYLED